MTDVGILIEYLNLELLLFWDELSFFSENGQLGWEIKCSFIWKGWFYFADMIVNHFLIIFGPIVYKFFQILADFKEIEGGKLIPLHNNLPPSFSCKLFQSVVEMKIRPNFWNRHSPFFQSLNIQIQQIT